ncbi:MAG: YggS family pyridoxal phosphate-dependent enzyme [Candidatus Diapherotrites archaeon]|nr:YggS family pyridoxal phosphate-dependent enzyme [Candidatus Diapherotrites archaeon]
MSADEKIKENLYRINEQIKQACAAAGRSPSGVSILAATKSQPIEKIHAAVAAGIKICGENYLQEAERKINEIGSCVEWHFIGHLQSNKAKKAGHLFDVVQTVDSAKLASRLNDAAEKKLPVLVEVNIGEEAQKFGVMPAGLAAFIRSLSELKNLEIQGLMCMPPLLPPEQARAYFKRMFSFFQQLKILNQQNLNPKILSMGMSNDFAVAVEEGATMVRIGTALLGERKD